MNKERPVAKMHGQNILICEYTKGESRIACPRFVADEIQVIEENRDFLPVVLSTLRTGSRQHDVEHNLRLVNSWLGKRAMSEKREGMPPKEKIQWQEEGNPHYMSFTDQYWLCYGDAERWSDLSFYVDKNHVDKSIGNILFSQNLRRMSSVSVGLDCPEYTTNGVLNKRWIFDKNGKPVLIKLGSETFKQEAYNEVIVTQLLNRIAPKNVKYAHYRLYEDNYRLCAGCRSFIDADHEFVPAIDIYRTVTHTKEEEQLQKIITEKNEAAKKSGKEKINTPEEQMELYYRHLVYSLIQMTKIDGKEIESYLDTMIMLDRMFYNMDRHYGNIGVIRNVNDGTFTEMAPLFDFGGAFFPECSEYMYNVSFRFREEELYRQEKIKPLDLNILNEVLTQANILGELLIANITTIAEQNNKNIVRHLEERQQEGRIR